MPTLKQVIDFLMGITRKVLKVLRSPIQTILDGIKLVGRLITWIMTKIYKAHIVFVKGLPEHHIYSLWFITIGIIRGYVVVFQSASPTAFSAVSEDIIVRYGLCMLMILIGWLIMAIPRSETIFFANVMVGVDSIFVLLGIVHSTIPLLGLTALVNGLLISIVIARSNYMSIEFDNWQKRIASLENLTESYIDLKKRYTERKTEVDILRERIRHFELQSKDEPKTA